MTRAAILGAGGFGTALAAMLARRGIEVRLWARRRALADELAARRENPAYLPGVALPAQIGITADIAVAVAGAEAAVLAVPSQAMREALTALRAAGAPALLLSTAKGLELGSLLRMSEVAASLGLDLVQLSGPSHAEEVGRGEPTALVAAHPATGPRLAAQALVAGPELRAYGSADRAGVELGGALKNVIALASGVSEGLGLGDNLRAALLTRGLAEMTRLGVALGAEPATFSGLAGLGDLLATAMSRHSRNRRAGIEVGKGRPLDEVLAATPMVVEGVPATRAALEIAARRGVEMPIAQSLGRILFEGAHPRDEMRALLDRAPKDEEHWKT